MCWGESEIILLVKTANMTWGPCRLAVVVLGFGRDAVPRQFITVRLSAVWHYLDWCLEVFIMASKKERIEARFPADLKVLVERAAQASGYTLTDYLANLVRNDAPSRLKAQSEIALSNEQFDHFIEVCEAPPAPSNKILDVARKLDKEGF
ncbi:MAG: hypothetical protein ACI89D_002472 [Bermanella sp.]|jgi:uncharacterized protein (DUF1778 family)